MEEDKLNNAINSLKKSISIYDANYCLATSQALKTVLNELERLQKEFEAVDHECSRLEKKENELEKENEHYKDLIYALETYYDITEEDLEKCIKEDR